MRVDIRQTEATLVASLTLGLFMGLRSSLVSWLRLGLQRKKPAQEFLFFSSSSSSSFFFFFCFLGPYLRHMDVPRLGVHSEL